MARIDERPRAQFVTRLGVIATTVGSAVGLGNIWRFPYEAGNNGGAAFLLLYIAFIIILGIPVICAEFMLGRSSRNNVLGTFRKLQRSGRWHYVGYIGILSALMILGFYSVVAGWTMEYFFQSVSGALNRSHDFHARFEDFSSGLRPVTWTVLFLLVNFAIIMRGVTKGIERMSNILMPILFGILIIFCVNSMLMPGAGEGLKFLFSPDFSKINGGVVLSALGQAFFSLSLGLGCMLTYASYFSDDTNILRSASLTAGFDTLVAVLSGIMIFPAVFTFGMSPEEGPTLVFEVLPSIFGNMAGGVVWSAMFFLMLFLASLTSTISMSEITNAFFQEEFSISRRRACCVTTVISLVAGVLCALSFSSLKWLNLFNLFNNVSSNVLLPIGGMFISLFVGWKLDRRIVVEQMTNGGDIRVRSLRLLIFCLKYIAPSCLLAILIMGCLNF